MVLFSRSGSCCSPQMPLAIGTAEAALEIVSDSCDDKEKALRMITVALDDTESRQIASVVIGFEIIWQVQLFVTVEY